MASASQVPNLTSTNQASNSTIQDTAWWIRVVLGVELCLTDALLHILHNYDNDPTYTGLTDDEIQLYNQMVTFKKNHKKKLCKVIHEDQWNILCPSSGRSDSSTWDITLLIVVIRYCTDLPAPLGGWDQKSPQKIDTSKAAFVLRSRKFRNDVKHGSIHDISTKAQFLIYWGSMETLLKGLNYTNMILFYDLETGTLKMYTKQMVKALEERIADVEDNNGGEIKSLKNHLFILQTQNNDLSDRMKKIETDFQTLKLKEPQLPTTSIYWNVYQNVDNFIGREDVFAEIENQFSSPNDTCDHNTVVIHGLGGVGKTEVAANYAKCHKNIYDNVIWLDCENIQDSVKELFTSYCSNNGQSSVTAYLNAIYTTLNNTRCLFILDNIEDYDDAAVFLNSAALFKFKPHFLVTSQLSCWDNRAFREIPLPVLSTLISESFFQNEFLSETKESIASLVDVLECFPLALQQARAYIQKHKISISDYVKNFKELHASLLNINLKKLGSSQYNKTLLTVWELAFQKIRSDETSLAILGIIAYMDGKRINKNTFLYHELINQDEIKLNAAIENLIEYSLIQVRNTEKYNLLSIHSLVQAVVRCSGAQHDTDYFDNTLNLLNHIASCSPYCDSKNVWYVQAKYILFQVSEIEYQNLLSLVKEVILHSACRLDFEFGNHLTNLVTKLPDFIKENMDIDGMFLSFCFVFDNMFIRGNVKLCKEALDNIFKFAEQKLPSKNKIEMYYLRCFSYYHLVRDIKNTKKYYDKIKDLTYFPFNESVKWNTGLYLEKLFSLKRDYQTVQYIIKNKTEWLNLITEPILKLGPILDSYGYKENELIAALYFHCMLWKIAEEIKDGEDKEDDIQRLKENVSCIPLKNEMQQTLAQLLASQFCYKKDFIKSLDILIKQKNSLLEKQHNLLPFSDNTINSNNMYIMETDLNIALILLRLKRYEEARDIVITLFKCLLGDEWKHEISRLFIVTNVMCQDFEHATTLNQTYEALIAKEYLPAELIYYLNSYKSKCQKISALRKTSKNDRTEEMILFGECVELEENMSSLCEEIIPRLTFQI